MQFCALQIARLHPQSALPSLLNPAALLVLSCDHLQTPVLVVQVVAARHPAAALLVPCPHHCFGPLLLYCWTHVGDPLLLHDCQG
jgi:hypothetical protein